MKKLLVVFISAMALFWTSLTPATAETAKVIVNGQNLDDGLSIIQNDRLMVPLKSIFEALGAVVLYNDMEQLIMAQKGATVIALQVNNKLASINNKIITLDAAPLINHGQILVPLSFVANALDAQVSWDNQTFTAFIKGDNAVLPFPEVSLNDKVFLYNQLKELENRYMEIRSGQGYTDRDEIAGLLEQVFADQEVARAFANEKEFFTEGYVDYGNYHGVASDWVGINFITMFTNDEEIKVFQVSPNTYALLAIHHMDMDSLFGIAKTTIVNTTGGFRIVSEDFYEVRDIICPVFNEINSSTVEIRKI